MLQNLMRRHRLMLLILIGLYIALAGSHAFLVPLWQLHEADYYNVLRFITTQNRLPTPADYPAGDADNRQATHPPLFFLVAVPFVAALDSDENVPPPPYPLLYCPGSEPANDPARDYPTTSAYDFPPQGAAAAAYALRLLNVAFGAAAVFFTYWAGRVLFAGRPGVALTGAAILALNPYVIDYVPIINNDALMLMFCAATCALGGKVLLAEHLRWWDIAALVLVTVLGVLTKLPGWALVALTVMILAYRILFEVRSRRMLSTGVAVIGLLMVAVGWFNLQTTGSLLGRYTVLDSVALGLLQQRQVPWVVVAGVMDFTLIHLLDPLTRLAPRAILVTGFWLFLLLCGLVVIVGVAAAMWRRQRRWVESSMMLLFITALTVVMVVLRNTVTANVNNTTSYNLSTIYAPPQYYAPALPALALLIAAGVGSLMMSQRSRLRAACKAAPPLVFGAVTVGGVLMLFANQPNVERFSAGNWQAGSDVQLVQPLETESSEVPQIVGYTSNLVPEAGWIDVTLYSRIAAPTNLNFVAQAQLDEDDSACEFLPGGRGVYPTSRWQPGEIVVSRARIPNCSANLTGDAMLSIRWLGYTATGELALTSPAVMLAQLDVPFAVASNCLENLGVIDERYQLVRWNSPPEVARGELYLPSVNWYVRQAGDQPATRVFTLVHEENGATYTCAGSPAPRLPHSWLRAEQVFFDHCVFPMPADAPTGRYQVYVSMVDGAAGEALAAVTPDGDVTERLLAGGIEVR